MNGDALAPSKKINRDFLDPLMVGRLASRFCAAAVVPAVVLHVRRAAGTPRGNCGADALLSGVEPLDGVEVGAEEFHVLVRKGVGLEMKAGAERPDAEVMRMRTRVDTIDDVVPVNRRRLPGRIRLRAEVKAGGETQRAFEVAQSCDEECYSVGAAVVGRHDERRTVLFYLFSCHRFCL